LTYPVQQGAVHKIILNIIIFIAALIHSFPFFKATIQAVGPTCHIQLVLGFFPRSKSGLGVTLNARLAFSAEAKIS
jgi:hypothetical protein